MAEKLKLLTVKLPEILLVEFAAAAKMRYGDTSELIRGFVVETIKAAKQENIDEFNSRLAEATSEREKKKKQAKGKRRTPARAVTVQPYLMSTGKGKGPNDTDERKGKADIKKARQVARDLEREKRK